MGNNIVIAIDGPSAAGKGTLAKKIAHYYDLAHLDTGALYRAVAFGLLQAGFEKTEQNATNIAQHLDQAWLKSPALRGEDVAGIASEISIFPLVREALKDWQRNFAKVPPGGKKGAVLDGRDIGTVICPDAMVKLFVTANAPARARRRCKELQDRGEKAIYAEILEDIEARDRRDQERTAAPLKPAKDALLLDTSDMNADEVFAKAKEYIDRAIKSIL